MVVLSRRYNTTGLPVRTGAGSIGGRVDGTLEKSPIGHYRHWVCLLGRADIEERANENSEKRACFRCHGAVAHERDVIDLGLSTNTFSTALKA